VAPLNSAKTMSKYGTSGESNPTATINICASVEMTKKNPNTIRNPANSSDPLPVYSNASPMKRVCDQT